MPDLVNIIGLENCQEDKHGIFKEGVGYDAIDIYNGNEGKCIYIL